MATDLGKEKGRGLRRAPSPPSLQRRFLAAVFFSGFFAAFLAAAFRAGFLPAAFLAVLALARAFARAARRFRRAVVAETAAGSADTTSAVSTVVVMGSIFGLPCIGFR
jgi:hypothetical protein